MQSNSLDDALGFLRPRDPKAAVRDLGQRYRELGEHLCDDPRRPFGDHDHLRSTRPLLAAFAVAHASALASLGAVRALEGRTAELRLPAGPAAAPSRALFAQRTR